MFMGNKTKFLYGVLIHLQKKLDDLLKATCIFQNTSHRGIFGLYIFGMYIYAIILPSVF